MEFAFHPEVLEEFKAEISYYKQIHPTLDAEFADEVLRLIELARLFPRLDSPEQDGIRHP